MLPGACNHGRWAQGPALYALRLAACGMHTDSGGTP